MEISHIVSPPEKTKEILAKSKIIANVDCVCRKNSNNPCSAPIDVCLIIDPNIAKDAIEEGRGKNVTVSEAMKILNGTTEIGLVHMLLHFRGHSYHAICSCCSCCCHDLALLEYGHRLVEKSEYIVDFDNENCTNCGLCVQYCHFKAWKLIDIDNNQVSLDKEKCYGCGVCVVHCPVGVIKLVTR